MDHNKYDEVKTNVGGKTRRLKGGLLRSRKRKKQSGKGLTFSQLVTKGKKSIKGIPDIHTAVQSSLVAIKRHKLRSKKLPRIIKIPTRGSGINLAPLLSAISLGKKVF